jgi:hypothetical protein
MTRPQLEWWILFGICVAGKSATQTQVKLDGLLAEMQVFLSVHTLTPFGCVRWAIEGGQLGRLLRKHRMGKYKLFGKAFRAAINLDLNNISVKALEKVPGIGPKTARMTILYYEPGANVVPLDTHILKFMRSLGHDAPKSTPSGRRYLELEKAFVAEAKRRGKTVRELDTEVWTKYARQPMEPAVA